MEKKLTYKKVIIVYCWGNRNAGDKAITRGTINLFKKIFPRSVITVVSIFNDRNLEFRESYLYINNKYHIVNVVPNFLSFFNLKNFKFLNRLFLFFSFISPRFFSKIFPKNNGLKELINSNLVVLNCGHLLFWNRRMGKSLKSLFFFTYPLIIAKMLRIPYGLYGQSFGPFEFVYLENVIKKFLKWLLLGSSFINVRESQSKKEINKIICKSECNIKTLLDSSFFLKEGNCKKSKLILKEYNLKPNGFIIFTLRLSKRGSKKPLEVKKYNEYALKLSNFISRFIEEKRVPVLIVNQVYTDIKDALFVYNLLQDKHKKLCYIIKEELLPEDLKNLYKDAKVLVGMRFHSLVFAISMSTPVLGIYYYDIGPKIFGIMRDFGMEDYVFDIESKKDGDFLRAIDELFKSRYKISESLRKEVSRLKVRSIRELEIIRDNM
jgi:colanic acid/amylovoran biosynthesis protein